MPGASRHAKPKAPKSPVIRFGAPAAAAAAALAGVAAAFVFVHGGSAVAAPSHHAAAGYAAAGRSTAPVVTDEQLATAVHRQVAVAESHKLAVLRAAARRKHLAALAAARLARQQAAAQASASPSPSPSSSPSPSPAPSLSSSGNAAASPLGICIRNAEEGGSYAWGPGNGGGAYQFAQGTWETYGGSASEYGVAGPAYQDQIFDNAIAAGGASNWTAYDGC
jgi:hypothetical protein